MKLMDPDQIGTEALRCLMDVKREGPGGPRLTHHDRTVLQELESDGLATQPEETESGYESELTGNGIEMLKAMGIRT
jgi:hypothetical protein